MQPSACCKVLANFPTSGTLSGASVDDLYLLMRSMMLLKHATNGLVTPTWWCSASAEATAYQKQCNLKKD